MLAGLGAGLVAWRIGSAPVGRSSAGASTAAPSPPGPPPDVAIAPRSAWAGASAPPPSTPLTVEAPGDVRTLVVHHTAGSNAYDVDDVPGVLRGVHAAHVGRGWPDVAYSFFVDRHGGVWEGRAGSLDGPVIGDATGGNAGHAVLCCLVGDHRVEAPTPAATAALTGLLAWLADRHGLEVGPGATATFTSRGSNRWPAGAPVAVPTIAGHRDVSRTECPGDAAYALVVDQLPGLVAARRAAWAAPTTTTAAPAPTAPTTVAGPGTPAAPAPATGASVPSGSAAGGPEPTADGGPPPAVVAAGAGAVVLGAAALGRRRLSGGG